MNFLKDFKPEIKTFLIVTVVAIVISVGGVFLLKTMEPAPALTPTPPAQQTPPPAPQSQTLDTSTWQTYRNNEYGFEVKYPRDIKFVSLGPNQAYLALQRKEMPSGTIAYIVNQYQFLKGDEQVAWIDVYAYKDEETLDANTSFYFCASQFDLNNVFINQMVFINGINMLYRKASAYTEDLSPDKIDNYYCVKNSQNDLIRFSFNEVHKEIGSQILSTFRFVE